MPSPKKNDKPAKNKSAGSSSIGLSKEAQHALDHFRLEEVASHLLRRAHFIAEDIFSREFASESLTPRQKAALVVVAQHPGLKQSELADQLHMDRNTIAEMVKRLCANEMLVRSPSEDDQRAYRLHIAKNGIETLNRVLPRDAGVEKKLLDKLPEEYRPLFVKCLKLIVESEPEAGL
ncbi:TPA: MarR family transcriptional regulator [Burkholderia cenocepacia]|uniref:MarR family winged helix-turn-helix transcriptional regulator n=1 Tax=unclassified Burkholderia TaxID=2613784 RepID=UPI00158BC38F|nr:MULTISPECIES: MarR family transcriptional regulator [unclassified Burkholderia]HEF5874960.1 MarR family transcriptional regulator [Burkholderia cenocepacia]